MMKQILFILLFTSVFFVEYTVSQIISNIDTIRCEDYDNVDIDKFCKSSLEDRDFLIEKYFKIVEKCQAKFYIFFSSIRIYLNENELSKIRRFLKLHFRPSRSKSEFNLKTLYQEKEVLYDIVNHYKLLNEKPLDSLIELSFDLQVDYFKNPSKIIEPYIYLANGGDVRLENKINNLIETRFEVLGNLISNNYELEDQKRKEFIFKFYNEFLQGLRFFNSLKYTETSINFINFKIAFKDYYSEGMGDVTVYTSIFYFSVYCVQRNTLYSKAFRDKWTDIFSFYAVSIEENTSGKLDSLIEQFKLEARQELARYENVNQD